MFAQWGKNWNKYIMGQQELATYDELVARMVKYMSVGLDVETALETVALELDLSKSELNELKAHIKKRDT
ncbi:hypothetical protein QUF64_05885 [Anaerolineales bacterium HSG6]|nr:hypothetical protein [Anaerolineales bacterium HSG6]